MVEPPKNMKVSWDYEIPNIWKNKIHVPNHQPGYIKFIIVAPNFHQSAGDYPWTPQSRVSCLSKHLDGPWSIDWRLWRWILLQGLVNAEMWGRRRRRCVWVSQTPMTRDRSSIYLMKMGDLLTVLQLTFVEKPVESHVFNSQVVMLRSTFCKLLKLKPWMITVELLNLAGCYSHSC